MRHGHDANGNRGRGQALSGRSGRGADGCGALAAVGIALLAATPASADMRVCNRTTYLFNVAIGYPAGDAFQTEGWWSIAADTCQSVFKGTLTGRFFYLHAVDINGKPSLEGTVPMCVERRKFEIRGIADCWRRGYEQALFAEVDTVDFDGWTVFLDEGGVVAK